MTANTNLYGRSCTPNLGGVVDSYSKDEVNRLLSGKINRGEAYQLGLILLADNAETQAGISISKAISPAGLQSKLSDSVSLNSSTRIASSKAVKIAYDLANSSLPKSGGTLTGSVTLSGTRLYLDGNNSLNLRGGSSNLSTGNNLTYTTNYTEINFWDYLNKPLPYEIVQSSNDYPSRYNVDVVLTYVSGKQPSGNVKIVYIWSRDLGTFARFGVRTTGVYDFDDTTIFELPTSVIGGTQPLRFKIYKGNFLSRRSAIVLGENNETILPNANNLIAIGSNVLQNRPTTTSIWKGNDTSSQNSVIIGNNSCNGYDDGTSYSTLSSVVAVGDYTLHTSVDSRLSTVLGYGAALYSRYHTNSVSVGYFCNYSRNSNLDTGVGFQALYGYPGSRVIYTFSVLNQPTLPLTLSNGTYNANGIPIDSTKKYSLPITLTVAGGLVTSIATNSSSINSSPFLGQVNDILCVEYLPNPLTSPAASSFDGLRFKIDSFTETGGGYNTAIGAYSQRAMNGGSNNTTIGYDSGSSLSTGSNNVIIGSNTGSSIATLSNNIIISDGSGNIRQFTNNLGDTGFGTSAPIGLLHLARNTGATLRVTTLNNGGGGNSSILMGNQDSDGTNAPVIIRSANKVLYFGSGNSWSDQYGGTFSPKVRIDCSSNAPLQELYSGVYYPVVTQVDVGTSANQIPLNSYLGKLAFLDEVSRWIPAATAPSNNLDINFQYVSDTSLKIRMRGSDGIVRSATLTLS